MKLLLLDKDGTLIKPKSGAKFVNQSWDQAALPGVNEAIGRYVTEGWQPVIISNQRGIEAGHKSLESVIDEMRFCLELFPTIKEAYFCPDGGAICWRVWREDAIEYKPESFDVYELGISGEFRKPNAGMLKLAIHIENADEVLYVGDRDEDEAAAIAANVLFIWAHDFRKEQ